MNLCLHRTFSTLSASLAFYFLLLLQPLSFAQAPIEMQSAQINPPLAADTQNQFHDPYAPSAELPDDDLESEQRLMLRDTEDPVLQDKLTKLTAKPMWAKAVREKRFAAALVDITDINAPRMASINGDVMIYSASLPKIAILLGVFQSIEDGQLTLTKSLKTKVTRMIRNSSNSAATELFYAVGPKNLADILQSERYRLYDPEWGGGLWVGKPYAKKQTWRRDPIANLSHGATALQVARFFYLLESEQLVSAESSAQMKEILGKPAINHKFVGGLRQARPGSKIYRKSGTWRTYHSDGGIIERDGRRYIAVVLVNDLAGSAWLKKLIVEFDDLIFNSKS